MDEWITQIENRLAALEWEFESAHGPNGETHPEVLSKDIAALRGKVGAIAEMLVQTRQTLDEVREMLAALLNSSEGPGAGN